ncbi:hypothetical protein JMN32_21810 [Fulvivirga sp. 29W222]|uniref:Secreted protein n=1 Tax=Fulvivirga marina TaxID=2494733 RepID=A0A937G1N9_9BACT|nr:hypothetical protein [Fulvivirga marina]MBL6448962.1 hypothetical protein [Fulvivirga marina]
MKIKKIALIAVLGMFGLTFTSCQEEEIIPDTDNVLNTEGVNEGHDQGPEDD